jgi:hypothetical protein
MVVTTSIVVAIAIILVGMAVVRLRRRGRGEAENGDARQNECVSCFHGLGFKGWINIRATGAAPQWPLDEYPADLDRDLPIFIQ